MKIDKSYLSVAHPIFDVSGPNKKIGWSYPFSTKQKMKLSCPCPVPQIRDETIRLHLGCNR